MDNTLTSTTNIDAESVLERFKKLGLKINKEWAKIVNINCTMQLSSIKPSGTVSQLVNSSSGIHPRYSPYYIRTVRADKKDPLAKFMIEKGFPVEDDIQKPNTGLIFSFPIKSPKDSICRDDRTAIEQLEHWLLYKTYWTEGNPSVTIYVRDEEWLEVGAWVYKHFDDICGVSFLPHTNHIYKQAPYQEITEEEYNEWLKKMPQNVDWAKLGDYEHEDMTKGSQELACTGSSCEIVDI